MANANSQVFRLQNGITAQMLGEAIVGFLRGEKGMTVEGARTADGYFVQAKSNDDGWKKVAGMSKATQVQIVAAGDMATVSIGQGKWSDKVGAGVVGAFLFAPLAVTAIVGAVGQNKLPGEILRFCEKYLMSGGQMVTVGAMPAASGQVRCSKCGTHSPAGTRFCNCCGTPLGDTCPHCGELVPEGTRFCPRCGSGINVAKHCPECGSEIQPGQAFCSACGAKQSQAA